MSTTRRGSTVPAILATFSCFGLLLAFLFFLNGSEEAPVDQAPQQQPTVATVDDSTDRPVDIQLPPVSEATPLVSEPIEETVVAETTSEIVPAELPRETADPTAERRAKVESQIAFGEFENAVKTAETATDVNERSELLKLVANAQVENGDFDAALRSIRRMPVPSVRSVARADHATDRAIAGGAAQADFQSLIDLIMSETEGPWEEVDGAGGTISQYETGVRVDPNGLLDRLAKTEHTGRLLELGIVARAADLNDDIARPSDLRLVSLTRLEREIARRIEAGETVTKSMKLLAGLTRIQYIFVYPESGEVVLGGPAEAWEYNANGLPVGVNSGKPVLQLDDLVTVMRTFSKDGMQIFGCSINPRQEGLRQLKQYVAESNQRGPLRAGAAVRNWVNTMQGKLGRQDIEVYGVPAESRVARVIVEADYRMKLIGIDKLDGGKNIPSIFDLFTEDEQKNSKLDALRWWLSLKYQSVLHSPDRNVFEIQGASVLCQSENQFVTDQGNRVQTGKADATNAQFAANFTKSYADLAESDIVFADLQNVFDCALVAALLNYERIPNRTDWDFGSFSQHGDYRPAEFDAPLEVESVVNHRVYRGRDIVVQVAGGVRVNPMAALRVEDSLRVSDRLGNMAAKGRAVNLPEGRWWWDALK